MDRGKLGPMERGRKAKRARAEAPSQYEIDQAHRRAWEKRPENRGKLYRGGRSTIGRENWQKTTYTEPAGMLDPTRLPSLSSEQARKQIESLKRDGEFMTRYLRGEPEAVRRMTILHRIAFQ